MGGGGGGRGVVLPETKFRKLLYRQHVFNVTLKLYTHICYWYDVTKSNRDKTSLLDLKQQPSGPHKHAQLLIMARGSRGGKVASWGGTVGKHELSTNPPLTSHIS